METIYYDIDNEQFELIKIQLINGKNYLTYLDEILMEKENKNSLILNDDECYLTLKNMQITKKYKFDSTGDVVFYGYINKQTLKNIL